MGFLDKFTLESSITANSAPMRWPQIFRLSWQTIANSWLGHKCFKLNECAIIRCVG